MESTRSGAGTSSVAGRSTAFLTDPGTSARFSLLMESAPIALASMARASTAVV
jgi:hypothetical protein